MSDYVEKELSEIKTLREIKSNIQEEINKLQITLSNLQAQEHSAQIKKDQDVGMQENEIRNKFASDERKIEIKRIEAEKRIDTAEGIERKVKDREMEVEKREQKLLNLEEQLADLHNQRVRFNEYKTGVEKQLEQAVITIAEANATFEKIDMERQMLVGREKKIQELEKYWNDCIGLLEEEKKQFQIDKENFLGLRDVQIR